MIWPCVSPRNMGILISSSTAFQWGTQLPLKQRVQCTRTRKGKHVSITKLAIWTAALGLFYMFLSWMSYNHTVSIISQIKKLNQVKSICFLDYHYHTFLNQETKSVKSGHCCQAEPFSRRENAKLLRRHIHQAGRFLRGKSAVCHGVCQYLPHETWSMTWWNYSLIEAWHHDEITC